MSIFADMLRTQKEGYTLTENGAVAHKSSGKHLLDMNFRTASMRKDKPAKIYSDFYMALQETPVEAMKWLFYLRDCRGGMGERRSFHAIFNGISAEDPKVAIKLLPLIPEYGYWKDVITIAMDSPSKRVKNAAIKLIVKQFKEDCRNMVDNKPISLLGKYMPRENSKDKDKGYLAVKLAKAMGMVNPETGKARMDMYRKVVSEVKHYLDLVETHLSAKDYEGIDYSTVPSKANKIYSNTFKTKDTERYTEFLQGILSGRTEPTTMKVGQLFPYEILQKITKNISPHYGRIRGRIDLTIRNMSEIEVANAMWESYPRDNLGEGVMVVLDRSGSMTIQAGCGATAMEVADSLGILFSESLEGEYKNSFITFSDTPKIFHLGSGTLFDKYENIVKYEEIANTNIEGVFDLILNTAKTNNYTQDQLPQTVLILSDMEFDAATEQRWYRHSGNTYSKVSKTLFDTISDRYASAGYKMPKCVFWNIAGRTENVPMKQNEAGVALVSGFSPAILKQVLSGSLDPWKNLQDALNTERYAPVAKALGFE